MERTNNLKEIYKRKNATEDKVLSIIIDTYPNLTIVRGKDVPDIKWCQKNIKGTVLIVDAKNSNRTEYGNNRVIEFCLIHKNKLIWIDAKHLNKRTNIADILYGEFERARICNGHAVFVCDGKGYTDKTMDGYYQYLKKNNIDAKMCTVNVDALKKNLSQIL